MPRRPATETPRASRLSGSFAKTATISVSILIILLLTAFVGARRWAQHALNIALPQIDGQLSISGLSSPVTVQRDAHGVPHIRASSLDDLVFAQGFVTAQDRLFQMDLLRRHAAGDLAEVLGSSMLQHDRIQRVLQLRGTADRAISQIPADQRHYLEVYARGVNASIQVQHGHLPLEFRLLHYDPAPWNARDSLLVGLVMFQDLTNNFTTKLNRESLAAQLTPDLLADLYPVGSWRDHPPTQPEVDLTAPQELPDIPLDESQSSLRAPRNPRPGTASSADLLSLSRALAPLCDGCRAGSNNWTVSGSRTATGKPMLSNDMHLSHSLPGIWYEADLQAMIPGDDFHAAGVSLPGVPFIIVGHNAHVAWGFTNLGADVQDVFIEHLRGSGSSTEYQSADGSWHPVLHQTETIHVRGKPDVVLDVSATQHGGLLTPIVSPLMPSERRQLALRWTIYDPQVLSAPLYDINAASDWPTFLQAFANFGGPAQNVVYADDQGHIGYHAVGRIPIRGNPDKPAVPQIPPTIAAPAPAPAGLPATPATDTRQVPLATTSAPATPISPVPVDAVSGHYDWLGYIPFVALPQSFDPSGGVIATANARVTPDNYPYTLTLDWAAPYRNERIWKVLSSRSHLSQADMLSLQTDVYSDLDHVIAQRLAYAIDHSTTKDRRLHQAADLLRKWNGSVDTDAAAPSIVVAARSALWELILDPLLRPTVSASDSIPKNTAHPSNEASLYTWGEKSYAAEQIIMHTPPRWLPRGYANWDELLTSVVDRGLRDQKAPFDLSRWKYGPAHPVDIEHPVYSQSRILRYLIGMRTGTGVQPQSGDNSTIKQVGRTFGPSERFTADLSSLDDSTLNIVLGQSGNPSSPWFLDQWPAWYHGATFPMPFSVGATNAATRHILTLNPQ
ncbi:MAG: penicillin acylase family protein [Edaphobacter sp.]|uniref:penicillin acylase family protein n=1 Tax=Edaphobacter sp. TaxID=1934404 RepID=UPI00239AD4CD|nr:penicillin acylase family protein [Edaphobacter sp.]MDE1176210.1 penicillin acylase family protein [Edaphobacter sp.]